MNKSSFGTRQSMFTANDHSKILFPGETQSKAKSTLCRNGMDFTCSFVQVKSTADYSTRQVDEMLHASVPEQKYVHTVGFLMRCRLAAKFTNVNLKEVKSACESSVQISSVCRLGLERGPYPYMPNVQALYCDLLWSSFFVCVFLQVKGIKMCLSCKTLQAKICISKL